jgi:methyl-accepting chemotaxis protein
MTADRDAGDGNASTSIDLDFMLISEETGQSLREFWTVLEPHLPDILNGFYEHVTAVPKLAQMIGNDIPRLKGAQQSHWKRLFSGRFDNAYMAGVRTIGLTHNRIGLEPHWYIGGYNYVLRRLTQIATKAHHRSPEKLSRALEAINTAILVDMDIAISVYQEAMLEERQKRQSAIENAINSFDEKMASTLETVSKAASALEEMAQTLSGNTDNANLQATAVAGASEQSSANVHTVAASAEELTSSITEISRQVANSSTIATKAMDEAARTNEVVTGLSGAADAIGNVIQLISDIAGQTNLLALNATIEAARAGEAGKGFAVVASEVKELASQTAKATDEIGTKIKEIQDSTKLSVSAIKSIGDIIREINETSATISAAVEQQSAATQEIARNVAQAAESTSEVSTNVAGITKSLGESGAIARDLLAASEALSREAAGLKGEVETFFSSVRAA